MDLHCECAESPAAEQPSGKINKTAFKIFGKRKSGGAMPSIFGVKNKGDGKSADKMGMVRSKTLDGLADVVLESSNKKDEQGVEGAAVPTDKVNSGVNTPSVTIIADVSSDSSVAKSHSFFNLLKRSSRSENAKDENAEQKPVSRQKKGLKGLFNSMRWNRKEKSYRDDREEASENAPGLILTGSLTASLECIKEEVQKPLCETIKASEDLTIDLPCDEQNGKVNTSVGGNQAKEIAESPCLSSYDGDHKPQEEDASSRQHVEDITYLPEPEAKTLDEKKDEIITGCGDIIADQDDDGGSSASARNVSGNGKKAICKKIPNIVAYQGGGEEMASPEQVDDTYIQDIWGVETQADEASNAMDKTSSTSQASGEVKHSESTCDKNSVKPSKLKQVAINRNGKGEQKNRGKDQQKCVRNSDEGYWDSTTSGPEEEPAKSVARKAIPRDSCSGDALYDLYTEPDENIAKAHVVEEIPSLAHAKPLSPVTAAHPVKTAAFTKDSKIPISVKHLPIHPPSHGADSSNSSSSAAVQPQPVKSELPRTKIPVSKVLVRRVSNKALTGTSVKPVYYDLARK
ncbi:APC membrane recruitment protein 2 [Spea bombifrons]|uniref:APC membrane recruitment protein 2 n=1 Tax=Spea bombifrons TaxID=233779 RepID=UPI0023498B55|nr:APC membrane recruitment protein 2 [Spea bombifrons]